MIKSGRMRFVGQVACMGVKTGAYRALVEKPERNRPLGRPRCRYEYNIKMDLRETGWELADLIHMTQITDQYGKHCDEPSGFIKCCEFLEWLRNCWLLTHASTPCS
jgi:hypothetical protein